PRAISNKSSCCSGQIQRPFLVAAIDLKAQTLVAANRCQILGVYIQANLPDAAGQQMLTEPGSYKPASLLTSDVLIHSNIAQGGHAQIRRINVHPGHSPQDPLPIEPQISSCGQHAGI